MAGSDPSIVGRALTVAGSDSGGGAGVQADIKTFAAFGVYGMSAITAVTAQNTLGVRAIASLPPALVESQIEAVVEDLGVDAIKTGMLANAAIVRAVAAVLGRLAAVPLVVDPVMRSKGGAPLLEDDAVVAVRDDLLPLAFVLTPNLPEAAALLGCDVRELDSWESRRQAATALRRMGAKHILIKGGHAAGAAGPGDRAEDLWFDGASFRVLAGPRIVTRHTHGTGCTLSAAICAGLAQGRPVDQSFATAKDFVGWAIAHAPGLGSGHGPLNHHRRVARGCEVKPR